MSARIHEVAFSILRCLRHFDFQDGNCLEQAWCDELVNGLNSELGISATSGRGKTNLYPGSRQSIDLLVTVDEGPKFWIESKGAWKATSVNGGQGNPAYRKHLLHANPAEHSALADILTKLPQLTTPGDYVGELLVGFDSVASRMDDEIAELVSLARLDRHPWETFHTRWVNPNNHDYRIGCWLWVRPAAVESPQ